MSSVSTIPAVIDAIVAAVTRTLPGVRIIDGHPPKDLEDADDIVCIGFTGRVGEPAVVSTITREQMATDPSRESYTISNIAASWAGEQDDPKLVRDGAYALVDGVVASLAGDATLERLVARIMVSTEAVAQEQTTKGATATVAFDIHIDAWTG